MDMKLSELAKTRGISYRTDVCFRCDTGMGIVTRAVRGKRGICMMSVFVYVLGTAQERRKRLTLSSTAE